MEAELDEHLGYDEYERSDNPDYRNGVKQKNFVVLMGKSLLMFHKTVTVILNRR